MNDTFWQDRPVFVTGCTGLLGSWLTAALVARGARVVGLVRDDVPDAELCRSGTIDRINVVHGDIADYELLERTLAEYEIETIFHLAAQTIVPIANRAPLSTFETNIRGTWLLLEAARRNPTVQRIVVASSDKAYGDQADLPYHEDMPLNGRHPYDVSKSCADLIALTYANTYDLPVVITRCANLFGGGDLNWSRIMPGTIRSALRGEAPLIRSDGKAQRDYIYVKDAVAGYLRAAAFADRDDIRGQAFNFGQGRPFTALEVVQTIIRLSGHETLQPRILNQARNEIDIQYLASGKANRLLGWSPRFDLERALEETIGWYRDYLGAADAGAASATPDPALIEPR